MKTKLFLTVVLLCLFGLTYAQKGYIFVVATRGNEGSTAYLSEIHKAKDFKKCSGGETPTDCIRNAMMAYLIGAGERAFNFDYYIFPNESSYDTLSEAEGKKEEAIKLCKTSGIKVQEVSIKPLKD